MFGVRSILPPFVIAAAIAYAVAPGVDWIAEKLSIWRCLGVFSLCSPRNKIRICARDVAWAWGLRDKRRK